MVGTFQGILMDLGKPTINYELYVPKEIENIDSDLKQLINDIELELKKFREWIIEPEGLRERFNNVSKSSLNLIEASYNPRESESRANVDERKQEFIIKKDLVINYLIQLYETYLFNKRRNQSFNR